MSQFFNRLRGTDQAPVTAAHRVAFVTGGGRPAFWAVRWILKLHGVFGAFRQIHIRDFRDHISGSIDLNPIANTYVFTVANRTASCI